MNLPVTWEVAIFIYFKIGNERGFTVQKLILIVQLEVCHQGP